MEAATIETSATETAPVEIVPGFDRDGNYLGEFERPVVMKPEDTHVYGQAGQLFLVRIIDAIPRFAVAVRNRQKKFWPLGLDFTASGASDPGETVAETTIRETREELGIVLAPDMLKEFASWIPRDGYWSCSSVFIYPWSAEAVPFNPDDIEEIRWHTAAELREAARQGDAMKSDLRIFLLSDTFATAATALARGIQ
jgi:8-oxo-dGTP pyrophosphatase MutT (NUDIX family)